MYRIWYSTESLADYFIDHTRLARLGPVVKARLYESDASNPRPGAGGHRGVGQGLFAGAGALYPKAGREGQDLL